MGSWGFEPQTSAEKTVKFRPLRLSLVKTPGLITRGPYKTDALTKLSYEPVL